MAAICYIIACITKLELVYFDDVLSSYSLRKLCYLLLVREGKARGINFIVLTLTETYNLEHVAIVT